MYALTNGPYLPSNKGSQSVGFTSDNYGGYLTPAQTQFAKKAGRSVIAMDILAWADQEAIPNQYSFIKDLIGARFGENPDKYKEHYNKMFATLGNGKLEINDVLAFPMNIWYKNWANKAQSKNPRNKSNREKDNENNNKGRREETVLS